MKLYGTPLSHFTRKVRILLDMYEVPYSFIDIGNVAESEREKFASNPLMKVPVFVDGDDWIIESDHIAQSIVQKVDPTDRYDVLSRDLNHLNIRAVLNGLMMEEVKLVLGKRTGVPVEQYAFFTKAQEAIMNALSWLEEAAEDFDVTKPGFKEFHLVCAFEHIAYYELVPLQYPALRSVVEKVLANPTIRQTSPFVLKPKITASM